MVVLKRDMLDPMERTNLTLSAGALAISAAFASPLFTLSMALGIALEAVNFRALRRAAAQLLSGNLAGARPWTAIFGVRFTLLAIAMYVALDNGAHPIGFVIGLSTIVPAVVISALRTPPPVVACDPPPPDDPSWDEWNPWLARERAPRDEDDIL